MAIRVKIIKRDGDKEEAKFFNHDMSYEHLKLGETVELQNDKGEVTPYCVQSAQWEFSHFGDTYTIIVIPKVTQPIYNK